MTTRIYSHLFSCLHDEPAPVGRLGRGAHHSVFRSVQWHDIGGDPLDRGRVHDFAVIWDEDHDERVIRVIERLHIAGLLWPIVFIGERKGVVTILFAQMDGPLQDNKSDHLTRIREIAEDAAEDSWTLQTSWFQRVEVLEEGTAYNGAGIINDDDWRVAGYLQGIDALWQLGEKAP